MTKRLPYSRSDRVATEIHQILAQFIHDELDDPRVHGVQLTQVKVSKDLRLARVLYFLRGTAEQRRDCQEALEHAIGKCKQVIGRHIVMRYMPDLVFHFDDTIERAERIDELLKTIQPKEDA